MKYCEKCQRDWPDMNKVCPVCHSVLKEKGTKNAKTSEQAQEYAKRKKVWTYLLILSVFISFTSIAAQWRTSVVSMAIGICVLWDIIDFKQKISREFKTQPWFTLAIIAMVLNALLSIYFVLTLYF